MSWLAPRSIRLVPLGLALHRTDPGTQFATVPWSGNLIDAQDNRRAVDAMKRRFVEPWRQAPGAPVNVVTHSHGSTHVYQTLTELGDSADLIERSVRVNNLVTTGTILHADHRQFFGGSGAVSQPPNVRQWFNVYSHIPSADTTDRTRSRPPARKSKSMASTPS